MTGPDAARVREVQQQLEEQGVQFCFASYVDIHGVPKGKAVPIEKFAKMCKGSELFTVGAMEGMGLVGPHEDECAAVPDLDSLIVCPWDRRVAWFAADLTYHGEPYANDSRTILRTQLARARERGWRMNVGIETEFYVLRLTPEGHRRILADVRYQGTCPAYDVHQTVQSLEFLAPMVEAMNALGWGVYSFDQEGGHSQYELDFAYTDALAMADRFVFLRLMAKELARRIGCIASFMPKPFPSDFRSGAHHNISLEETATGRNLFEGDVRRGPGHQGFSPMAYHFAGGLLAHAEAITAIACPTYNSYQGLLAQGDMPDTSWAPVVRCFGHNNRSAMLRLPMNRPCIENRAADMAMNPYLSFALHLGAGLEGIDRALEPGVARNDNLYAAGEDVELLPRTLLDAIRGFRADPLPGEIFGEEMKRIFIKQKTREWERHFYHVSPQQLDDMLTFL
jgi:glutamine synthetase